MQEVFSNDVAERSVNLLALPVVTHQIEHIGVRPLMSMLLPQFHLFVARTTTTKLIYVASG